jgi:hypothetical protein
MGTQVMLVMFSIGFRKGVNQINSLIIPVFILENLKISEAEK